MSLTESVFNKKATVVNASDDEKRVYTLVLRIQPLKERYRNHTQDFNHERCSKCGEF